MAGLISLIQEPVQKAYYRGGGFSRPTSSVDAFFFWAIFLFVLGTVGLMVCLVWRESKSRINRQVIGILKARYASGELSREEFDEIRREIERV